MKIFIISVAVFTAIIQSNLYATNIYSSPAEGIPDVRTLVPIEDVGQMGHENEIPFISINKVDIDIICDWIQNKLFEIIYFLQTLAQPVTIIVFIIFAFIALVGAIGSGGADGILGMLISIIVYGMIANAFLIFMLLMGWISI